MSMALSGGCGAHIPPVPPAQTNTAPGSLSSEGCYGAVCRKWQPPKTRTDAGHWVIFTSFRRTGVVSLSGSLYSFDFCAPVGTLQQADLVPGVILTGAVRSWQQCGGKNDGKRGASWLWASIPRCVKASTSPCPWGGITSLLHGGPQSTTASPQDCFLPLHPWLSLGWGVGETLKMQVYGCFCSP